MSDAKSAAECVIELFGGASACARRLGLPQSTVSSWRRGRGLIPAWHHRQVLEAAKDDGIDITAEDLIGARRTAPTPEREVA